MRPKSKSRASKRKQELDSSSTSEPQSKRPAKKKDNEPKVDKYCWLCHTKDIDKSCTACFRSFHNSCLDKISSSFTESGGCPECEIKSVDGTVLRFTKYLGFDKLKRILDILTRRSFEKNRQRNNLFLTWPEDRRDNLLKIMDFEILLDNVNHVCPYANTAEFFGDMKFICHNACIAYGDNTDEAKAAYNLRRDFKSELIDLEACAECYYHMHCVEDECMDPFVRLCESPHDIIWAQLTGHPYWPAKCLKVIKDIAHVRFFGEHEVSNIPISKCFFLSESHPKDKDSRLTSIRNSGPKSHRYRAAKEELLRYIQVYRRKYGEFPFYPHKTPYKPNEIQNGVLIESTEGNCMRNPSQMKMEANVHEMCPANPTIVVISEESTPVENNMTSNISISNETSVLSSETQGQYPTSDQINSNSERGSSPCQGSGTGGQYSSFDELIDSSLLPHHESLNRNPPAVTSINMTFSTDENNFNTETASSVVASVSSVPPIATVSNVFSHSSENDINLDRKNLENYKDVLHHASKGIESVHTVDTRSEVLINNVSNHSSLQPYSSNNFVNNIPMFPGSQTDFDDEVLVIEEHRNNTAVGGFNPQVVLPLLLEHHPEVKDLIQKSRYLSDALIIQLYASLGKNYNSIGQLSKLCVELRKSKSEHKKSLEQIDKFRKQAETSNNIIQGLNDHVNKLENIIKDLETKLELKETSFSEAAENANLVMRRLRTSYVKKVQESVRAQHLTNINENQKAILEKINSFKEMDETVKELRESNKIKNKEYEDLKAKYQRAEDKINDLKLRFGPDVINNYKRMHYCWVCGKSAGEVCCLNTSYCSLECKESDAERHKKYCRKDEMISQIVQQRVISQQSIVITHGYHSGRPVVSTPSSPEVSDTEKRADRSSSYKNPQIHHLTPSPLLPTPSSTPHYRGSSSSSRSYSSKGKRRSCR